MMVIDIEWREGVNRVPFHLARREDVTIFTMGAKLHIETEREGYVFTRAEIEEMRVRA